MKSLIIWPLLYVPLDSPLVSSLMAVYQEETGDRTPAMSSGGATFARTMGNCVAFGALSQVQNRPSTKPMNEQKLTISMLRWKSIEKPFKRVKKVWNLASVRDVFDLRFQTIKI